jgi:hypothetical protein
MASESIDPFEVYRGVRRFHAGVQLERLFRGLCYLLHTWRAFGQLKPGNQSPRKLRYGKADDGDITSIEFDKFINVVCRMWTRLFQVSGLPLLDRIDTLSEGELDEIVRFKPPVDEVPGLHGPGEARTSEPGHRAVYVVQMLSDLFRLEDIPYFTFEGPMPTERDEVEEEEPRAAGGPIVLGVEPDAIVKPGLPVKDDAKFWSGFTEREIKFFRDLGNALKHLGPTEIRALGTHKDAASTVAEVERELRWAKKQRVVAVAELQRGRLSEGTALRLLTFASEAVKKASTNRVDYRSGCREALKELADVELRQAFEFVQKPEAETWGSDDIPQLVVKAERWLGASKFLFGLAYFQGHPKSRESEGMGKAARHQWKEGIRALSSQGVRSLPGSVQEAFEAGGDQVKRELVESLVEALKNLPS